METVKKTQIEEYTGEPSVVEQEINLKIYLQEMPAGITDAYSLCRTRQRDSSPALVDVTTSHQC